MSDGPCCIIRRAFQELKEQLQIGRGVIALRREREVGDSASKGEKSEQTEADKKADVAGKESSQVDATATGQAARAGAAGT